MIYLRPFFGRQFFAQCLLGLAIAMLAGCGSGQPGAPSTNTRPSSENGLRSEKGGTTPPPSTRSFAAHSESISLLLFSPDSRQLLTASSNNTYQAKAGQMVSSGRESDKTLLLWDVDTGKQLQQFAGHADGINCAAFLPDGKRFVSGSLDHTLRVWDAASGKELQQWVGHTGPVNSLALDGQGVRAVSGGRDGSSRVWDIAAGKELQRFKGSKPVLQVALTQDGRRALTVDEDQVILWDTDTGQLVHRLELSAGGKGAKEPDRSNRFLCPILPGDGKEVWVLHPGLKLFRWRLDDGTPLASQDLPYTLALKSGYDYKDDGTPLASRDLPPLPMSVGTVAVTPDGQRCLIGSPPTNGKMLVTVFELPGGKVLHKLTVSQGGGLGPSPLAALSPDGRYAVITQPYGKLENDKLYLTNNYVHLYRLAE